ncbi:Fc.00g047940.m01.CDS01 [Cosmosporella sp. VM-42]
MKITCILLGNGAQVDAPTSRVGGMTALCGAMEARNYALIRALMSQGADPNPLNTIPTPLGVAVEACLIPAVRKLLDLGVEASTLATRCGRTPLELAVSMDHVKLVDILLSYGIDPNWSSGQENSLPLHQALGASEPDVVVSRMARELIGHGTNLNTYGRCPPRRKSQTLETVHDDYSLRKIESCWATPLQAAGISGHAALVEVFLNAHADINAPAAEEVGVTALQGAIIAGDDGNVITMLLDAGADINAPIASRVGFTALQAAVYGGKCGLARRLLDAGANVNAPAAADSGVTALQGAILGATGDMIKLILDAGADVNAPAASRMGRTALQAAVLKEDSQLVKDLLFRGVNVNGLAAGFQGATAL